jgi:ankyrin repeat protein
VVKSSELTVKLLLEHGAHINVIGGKYDNALNAARAMGRENIKEILLEAGAKVKMRGHSGHTIQAAVRNARQNNSRRLEEQMVIRWAS